MKRLVFLMMLMVCSYAGAQETKSDKPAEAKAADSKATEGKPVKMELAGGKISLTAPADWKQVTPRFPQMTAYEFNYPADAKGEAPVRVTVMQSGGGLQGNLDRWYGQFTQPDGKSTKDVAKMESFDVAGQKVHLVKITGTYAGGMAASGRPVQKKENHMLQSGVIETKDSGTFFVTMTGPVADCEKLAEGFLKMLKALEAK